MIKLDAVFLRRLKKENPAFYAAYLRAKREAPMVAKLSYEEWVRHSLKRAKENHEAGVEPIYLGSFVTELPV